MKQILLIFLCLSLSGCATASRTKQLESQIAQLQEEILKKDTVIQLNEKQLKEKDQEIGKLRKDLQGFGVF